MDPIFPPILSEFIEALTAALQRIRSETEQPAHAEEEDEAVDGPLMDCVLH